MDYCAAELIKEYEQIFLKNVRTAVLMQAIM